MLMPSRGVALRPLALAAALVALTAATAGAQGYGIGPSWEITAWNGYYVASDLYTALNNGGQGSTVGLSNGYMWGGRLGFNPNPRLGLEFAYTRSGSDVDVKNAFGTTPPGGNLGRLDLNSYDLNFLFYQQSMGNPRVNGFFTLGFGWTLTDPKIDANSDPNLKKPESNSLFAWNMGLGTKVDLNERFLLRLDARWRVTDTAITTSSGVYCDYYGSCYSYASDWYNSGEFSAGLTLKFPRR